MKVKITKLENGITIIGEPNQKTDEVQKRLLDSFKKNESVPEIGFCILCETVTVYRGALVFNNPKTPSEISDGSLDFHLCEGCMKLPDVQKKLAETVLLAIKQKMSGLN